VRSLSATTMSSKRLTRNDNSGVDDRQGFVANFDVFDGIGFLSIVNPGIRICFVVCSMILGCDCDVVLLFECLRHRCIEFFYCPDSPFPILRYAVNVLLGAEAVFSSRALGLTATRSSAATSIGDDVSKSLDGRAGYGDVWWCLQRLG